MALVRMKPPVGVSVGLGADDKLYYIDGQGFANVDSGSVTKLTAEGWVSAVPVAPEAPGNTFPVSATKTLTGGISLSAGDTEFSAIARNPILSGASAGQDSGWLPLSSAPERFVYQLDSGTTATTFSVDISANGVSSLGQAFTGTYASSTVAEITPPIMFSDPLAKFFRWNVVSGGPLSVSRGA